VNYRLLQKTFDNAVIECKKKSMILAVPETREENKCLQIAIAEQGGECLFLLRNINYYLQNTLLNISNDIA